MRIFDNHIQAFWLAISILLGFAFSTTIAILIGNTIPVNRYYRGLVVVLGCMFIGRQILRKRQIPLMSLSRQRVALSLMLGGYTVVFLYGLFVDQFFMNQTYYEIGAGDLLLTFLSFVFIPTIFLFYVDSERLRSDLNRRLPVMAFLGALSILFGLVLAFELTDIQSILTFNRYRVTSENDENVALGSMYNPIYISRYGMMCGLCGLSLFREQRWLSFGLLFAGILLLVLGGSRGPLLGLVLGGLIVFSTWRGVVWFGVILLGLVYSSGVDQITLLQRLAKTSVEEESRYKFLVTSITDSLSNGLLGGDIWTSLGVYSHNIFADVLLSLGLIGLGLFSWMLWRAFLRPGVPLLTALFVGYTVCAMLSGTFYNNTEMWFFLVILLL